MKKRKQFTLIELMVVIVIISLLAGVALPTVLKKLDKAKVGTAKGQIAIIEQAIDDYSLDTSGKLPSSLDCLMTNSDNVKGWNGPYLKRSVPKDPWKNDYVLTIPGNNGKYDIICYGADGVSGGTGFNADIGNWAEEE